VRQVGVEVARGQDDAGRCHLGGSLDDARSADAAGTHLFRRVLGVPLVEPDDLEADVERLGIDAYAFDRPGRRPHAELYVRSLQSRPRGARRRQKALPVAEHQLAVGAYVDDQQDLVLLVGLLDDDHGHIVGADESRLHRKHVQTAAGVERQAYGGGEGVDGTLRGRGEGCDAERAGVEPQEEVMHGGVAHHDAVEDVVGASAAARSGLGRQVVHLVDDGALQLLQPAGMVSHVVQPGDEIIAERHLRVHGRFGGEDLARGEVDQVGSHGGGPDVDGQAQEPGGRRGGPHRYDPATAPYHHVDLPAGIA